jgi:hypothetical protein
MTKRGRWASGLYLSHSTLSRANFALQVPSTDRGPCLGVGDGWSVPPADLLTRRQLLRRSLGGARRVALALCHSVVRARLKRRWRRQAPPSPPFPGDRTESIVSKLEGTIAGYTAGIQCGSAETPR